MIKTQSDFSIPAEFRKLLPIDKPPQRDSRYHSLSPKIYGSSKYENEYFSYNIEFHIKILVRKSKFSVEKWNLARKMKFCVEKWNFVSRNEILARKMKLWSAQWIFGSKNKMLIQDFLPENNFFLKYEIFYQCFLSVTGSNKNADHLSGISNLLL